MLRAHARQMPLSGQEGSSRYLGGNLAEPKPCGCIAVHAAASVGSARLPPVSVYSTRVCWMKGAIVLWSLDVWGP
jgi:hypothetical protein